MRSTAVIPVLLVIACAVVVVSAAQRGQPPARPQFRTAVEVVQVDVSVLDDKRRPVRGLAASDFTILENGRPQELVSFAAIDVAPAENLGSGWLRDIAPDVRSNLAAADRLIVLVLDDAQTRSGPQHTKAIKDMAQGVINRLGPNDLACVVFTRDNRAAQPFTNERHRLLAAVDAFHGEFGGSGGRSGADSFSAHYWYTSSLKTLRYVAESLYEAAQRRKVVIYLSPGVPIEGSDLDAFSRRQETQRLIEDARRANVTFYGLDPSGLGGLDSEGAGLGSVQRQANDFLESIAASTGGRALLNRNDFVNGVNEVFDENASYYLLGYRSTNPPGGSEFRRIAIHVDRPGVTVRARSGYVSAKPKSRDQPDGLSKPLVQAMRDAAPRGDIAMQMTAAPFALANNKGATVAVVVALRQPRLALGGSHADYVNLIVGAYAPNGRHAGSDRLNARLSIRDRGGDRGEDRFVRYELLTDLRLPPGRYQLRVAAESALHATEGSLHYDLDVPDFSKGDLRVSGVLLSVEPNVVAAGAERLSPVVPVVPTSRREFWESDRVTMFARIYRGLESTDAAAVTLRIRDANDRTVFERKDSLVANLLGSLRARDYAVAVPIASLPPGPYLLTFEAATARETVRRDVRFARR